MLPNKRHTQMRDNSGKLFSEELISRNGFNGMYSNLYHINPPSAVQEIGKCKKIELSNVLNTHRPHHLETKNIKIYKNENVYKLFKTNEISFLIGFNSTLLLEASYFNIFL